MTIIHADNGGGKTSLLAALEVGMGGWFSELGVGKRSISPTEVHYVNRLVGGRVAQIEHYPVTMTCSGEVTDASITWARSLRRAAVRLRI